MAARLAVGAGYPPLPMAVRAIAVAPLVLPFAIAVLFGNLDAWYPLAYGALLLAALPGSTRRMQVAGRRRRRDHLDRQAPPGAAAPVDRAAGLA